jgi:hypothetical protein
VRGISGLFSASKWLSKRTLISIVRQSELMMRNGVETNPGYSWSDAGRHPACVLLRAISNCVDRVPQHAGPCLSIDKHVRVDPKLDFSLGMRRAIAISLMVMFSWTPIAPVFASDAGANLPACCRRNGKHHCRMERSGGQQKGFTSVTEKCPCLPVSTCAVASATFKPEAGEPFCADGVRPAAIGQQAVAFYRDCSLRSHRKRGPPTPLA